MFLVEKILVLILLDMMFQQVETICFVIASIVFFLLMRANREPYRMGLKTLEHHALLAELKFRQHVGCNYFVSVLIVIQILYEIPRFLLSGQRMNIAHVNIVEPHVSVLNVWLMNSIATIVSWL